MKTLALTLTLLAIACASATAQAPKPFDLYAGVGMTFGSSPEAFKAEHKEGYHLLAGVGFKMIPVIQFVGKLEYHSFSKDFDDFRPDITDLSGGTRRLLMFGADARLALGVPTASLKPFAFAGLGLARQSQSDFQTAVEIAFREYDSHSDLYLNIGGGLEFKFLQIFNVFIQGKYLVIKQDESDLVVIPVTVGIKL